MFNYALSNQIENSSIDNQSPFQIITTLVQNISLRQTQEAMNITMLMRWQQIYESSCLFLISRMLSVVKLRPMILPLLTSVSTIPNSCLKFLKLLMLTGTKMSGNTEGNESSKGNSIRIESMNILMKLVYSTNEVIAREAIDILLWSALSDDFETRSKIIATLIR